jgi:hypothetical protein
MASQICFELVEFEVDSDALVPVVDGRSFVDIVTAYEREQRFDVVGGYSGLVLDNYDLGDLRRYLMGEQKPWPARRVPLLGCDCGEWACWPLIATVSQQEGIVRWSDFEQPHRPRRDYAGLGPFHFDLAQYEAAVDAVAEPTVALWRPTGPEELALVAQSAWRSWPPRLADQPIFYPVLNREYATKIARDWNVPRSGAGYVMRFRVRRSFLDGYAVQQAGGRTILEYWIPAEDLDGLNANIIGRIELVEEFRSDDQR